MSDETTELLRVGDILFNEPCDERIVVIAANERNVWLRKVGKNDELAMLDGSVWAMLGLERNVKSMCTQSYAQHAFELDGHVEQAVSETHGTLTAELVERIVDRNCEWYEGGEIDAQAIADELNAVLGSGTCEVVSSYYYDDYDLHEFNYSCGHSVNLYDSEPTKYCPECGARVVER